MKQTTKFWIASGMTLCCFTALSPARAQITSDRTLSTKVNSTDNRNFTITGGNRVGRNLFHSFSEFSVPTEGLASFVNALDIQNIIGRVTGESVSNIDGKLQANGTANLFLLNPNGIIFGSKASLDIGGSFLASTASSLNFADGTQFSATPPQTIPLLTVSVPVGLQFGKAAERILVKEGASLAVQPKPDKTLALVGGNVRLKGGSLEALGGRVELGGVAEPGTVGLNISGNNLKSLSFPAPSEVVRADVFLTNGARVDVAAADGGSIAINARNIEILGKKNLLRKSSLNAGIIESSMGSTDSQAGDITLNATEKVTVFEQGEISNTVDSDAQGRGGNINITVGSLLVNNAQLLTNTSGNGKAGNISVRANDSVSLISSFVLSNVNSEAKSDAGNIDITTGSLWVESTQLNASTYKEGNAGSITINARDTVSFKKPAAKARSEVEKGGMGNGGTITITTGSLELTQGAELDASTKGKGNAGSITINARDEISLVGSGSGGGIFSRVGESGMGNGGTIDITTGSLSVADGARIATSTNGAGNAGTVVINARDTISLEGMAKNREGEPRSSGIFSRVGTNGSGGNITLNTTNLNLIDGAEISADTDSGNGGNINLQVQDLLLLRRMSEISTTAGKAGAGGDGGTINIDAPLIFAVPSENSDISTNAFTGNGGRVEITTQGIFGIEFRKETTSLSDITASSEFGVSGTVNINTPDVDPSRGLVALPEEVDASGLIAQGCSASGGTASRRENKFVVTGRGGLPPNPSEPLGSETVLADWVTPGPKVKETSPSGSAPTTTSLTHSPSPVVEAQGWVRDLNGQVILTTQAPIAKPYSPQLTPTACRGS